MTGFDRLSYQSRWLQVEPERKFLLWLLLMALAFTLPAWGQALTLALTAALTCWLLRVSFWRWCRWMALPFGFLLVGVLTILFSVSRDPQMLLASFRLGAFSIGISAQGWPWPGRPSGAAWRRWRRRSGWCLICLSPS